MWNLKENLWADFEDSLAHMDDEGMLETIPDMMDIMGVLDEDDDDFSAADFFVAAEWSVNPLQVIRNELPKQFHRWINSLKPSSTATPLNSLICAEARYINFNYTEFLESIYGVKKKNILYIHGDRRDKQQELVLGHAPGAEDDPAYHKKHREPRIYNQTSYDMYETAARYIGEYYDVTTKKSDEVIKKYKNYFKEIIRKIHKGKWMISWHSSSDLERIKEFINVMGIQKEQVILFRT